MWFSKFCQKKHAAAFSMKLTFPLLPSRSLFWDLGPCRDHFCHWGPCWVLVYLFKKRGFIHLGVIFESLIRSLRIKVVANVFTQLQLDL